MERQLTMDELLNKINLITQLYHVVRIVDPIHKEAFFYQNKKFSTKALTCYNFWEKNYMCENCISIQALQEGEIYAKLEFKKDITYMILAVPLQLKDRKVVLELMRDITKERILFDSIDDFKEEPYSLLKNRNENIIKDSLTNLFNKRYIYERLPFDILSSNIKEEFLSLLMINIDDFKEINKNYGHSCGDWILSEFGKILKKQVETKNQWVARYNADTFIIVLNHYTLEQSKQWAENLKDIMKDLRFHCGKDFIYITASIGVYTTFKADISMEELLHRAKTPLKEAKAQGKNCIVVY